MLFRWFYLRLKSSNNAHPKKAPFCIFFFSLYLSLFFIFFLFFFWKGGKITFSYFSQLRKKINCDTPKHHIRSSRPRAKFFSQFKMQKKVDTKYRKLKTRIFCMVLAVIEDHMGSKWSLKLYLLDGNIFIHKDLLYLYVSMH